MDLLIGQTSTETDTLANTVIQVVIDQRTHSLFGGLLAAPARSKFRINGEAVGSNDVGTESVTDGGKKFARSLMHFTAVKDFKVGHA
jgi:hypothetical protein